MSLQRSEKNLDERFATVAKSKTFRRVVEAHNLDRKAVLDLGCSFGEHLIHFGKGSAGITTTKNEAEEGKHRGLTMLLGNAEEIDRVPLPRVFDAIWSNNMLEHILSPHAFLIKLKTIVPDNGLLVLGVPVIPKFASLARTQRFRGALASPHTNFFTYETLRYTLQFAGWRVETMRPYFFSTPIIDRLASVTVAPHLYVTARNIGNFRYPEKKIREWIDEPYYHELLRITQSVPED